MKTQNLNGKWKYRIGKGKETDITVPFSAIPVGHFECRRQFDCDPSFKGVILKFDGITYQAEVYLNGEFLDKMGPYCEYTFDISDKVKEKDNELLVLLEDTSPAFGPTAGWENFGGIIRDVSLLYYGDNYIKDVFFYSTLKNNYTDADFTVETQTLKEGGNIKTELFYKSDLIVQSEYAADGKPVLAEVKNVKLWSPDSPELYTLKVTLFEKGEPIDEYTCKVGFREFKCDKHRFLLNGKPLFLKGVCKHEMFGDSGHCPTIEQITADMRMIKNTGANFVRLVHYPHNKKTLDIADELGLMVSEEPGLWWSDTGNPEVRMGSLEVLKRTVLRDRNHPSIVFWLSFNECKFTKEYLIDSANTCRKYDHTRLVSGANCMSDEETLEYFNLCGFDFYTMHPYAQTVERAKNSAKILNDKPLLFTEWGGHFVYDNPKLFGEFMDCFYNLYLENSDKGALAGAFFWEWSELGDYNRGRPACVDGNLYEGLVDKYRRPNLIFTAFCNAIKRMDVEQSDDFWIDFENPDFKLKNTLTLPKTKNILKGIVADINKAEAESGKLRKRKLTVGPLLQSVKGLRKVPLVINDNASVIIDCDLKTEKISIFGGVSIIKGYPLGGDYGEGVATVKVIYEDGEEQTATLCNGQDITTVFGLNLSSKINPVAENAKRIATFGYDKNFEYYILNELEIPVDANKKISKLEISSLNNGYALLLYGVKYTN